MVSKAMCQRCRQTKQACTPEQRIWVDGGEQQPCARCLRYGHECGPNIRLPPVRPRRRNIPIQQRALSQPRPEIRLSGPVSRDLDNTLMTDVVDSVGDDIGMENNKDKLERRLRDLDVQVEALKRIQLEIEYLERNHRQNERLCREMHSLKNASTRQLSETLVLAESLADRVYPAGEIEAAERAYYRILGIYRMMDIKAWHEVHNLLLKMAKHFWRIGEPLRAEKLLWECLELGKVPRRAQETDLRVLIRLAKSLIQTSKDLSMVVQDMEIDMPSELAMSIPPIQRMLESKYASEVIGNVFQTGPLTDNLGLFPPLVPIVGGFEASQTLISMFSHTDLQATDLLGRTPLFLATDLQKEHFGLALMMHAANHPTIPRRLFTNARDKSEQTILGIAIWRHCSVEYLDALIDHGAEIDPESLTESVMTPLQIASWLGYSEIVDLLLTYGAQPGRAYPGTTTAEEFAQEAGHQEIVEKIRSYAAG